jgi:hypothetical protein
MVITFLSSSHVSWHLAGLGDGDDIFVTPTSADTSGMVITGL